MDTFWSINDMKITKQYDSKDCGLHVLQYLFLKLNKEYVDINYLKLKAHYTPQGINLANLSEIASQHGVKLDPYNADFDSIKNINKVDFPLLVLVKNNELAHYLIVEKITHKYLVVQDSNIGGRNKLSFDEFKSIYQNVIIFAYKMDNSKNEKAINEIEDKVSSMFTFTKQTFGLLLLAILSVILTFSSSFFVKLTFDYVLPNNLIKTLIVLFISFLWINILRFINSSIKDIIIRKLSNKIELEISENFYLKIQRLPINELNKMTHNELIKRASYINFIANYKANFVYSFFVETASIIVSCVLLIWLNYLLFLIILIFLIFAVFTNVIFQMHINRKYNDFISKAHQRAESDLDVIFTLNTFNTSLDKNFKELKRREKMLKSMNADYSMFNKKIVNNLLVDLVIGNLGMIIVFTGCLLIFKNSLTVGTLVMVLTTLNYFVQPITSLTSIIMMKNIVNKHIQMVNFVLNLTESKIKNEGVEIKNIDKIELTDINFGFDYGKKILNIKSLVLPKNTQIIGSNGGGKTTLLNLLNYRICNWLGQIRINDIDLDFIDNESLKENSILISSDPYLPSFNIIEFITSNNKQNQETLLENIKKYKLDELMDSLRLNLYTELVNNGSNISKGQKQFIVLLKLFTKKYRLIMLDEAFDNVDEKIFKLMIQKIKEYQKDAFFIEISHNKKYVHVNKEVDFDKINKIN
ncbi:ATP-binding cassette domain-containing protein [Mycoplasma sp. ES3225-GEN-MYC]|uniref:ATP-binding cassette domain-containing protein n=1 Tax=Mycoplasma miroungigenitalium TaxID=754515 RepID=A0A6M4JBQ9_9MOLU|nr:cysteine peptidase family C39 domain-containing protein [Mycoplasma miroungigenitalium]MBU4691621.1 ATP-binding cassette domain-containing protein [Mycoplasma miroungigenitalium]QJR43446.1 ATP-binding cassette domain-containing protein [Mycoplasma miroungigenitalium]